MDDQTCYEQNGKEPFNIATKDFGLGEEGPVDTFLKELDNLEPVPDVAASVPVIS